ncbi:hypothetical protein [Sphaerisporangium rhizosphaerae]|uniref:Resolvase/invertase-type recombinase catalytic domain-containing protein n=1 Tax=Sphaerisporangium rhizosphaerae TaxID=2269375 RepID=A0ABW2PFL7_9ACTN
MKVLEGIAAGEHTERSFLLDLALARAEDRRRDIVKKTLNGLEAARRQGKVGGHRGDGFGAGSDVPHGGAGIAVAGLAHDAL